MPPPSDSSLLNEHQRRRLSIVLGHLQQSCREIAILVGAVVSPRGLVAEAQDISQPFRDNAPSLLAQADLSISRLAERFDLPRREHSQRRWVRSVLSLLINDLYEVHASDLRGYGEVHPSLAAVLDPGLSELQDVLRTLLRLLGPDGERVP